MNNFADKYFIIFPQEVCSTDNEQNISSVIESDEELEMEMLKVSSSGFSGFNLFCSNHALWS